eukprot:5986686-Pyramimonas_sp.AAC.1
MKRELGVRVYSNIVGDSWAYTGHPPPPPPPPPPPSPPPPLLPLLLHPPTPPPPASSLLQGRGSFAGMR